MYVSEARAEHLIAYCERFGVEIKNKGDKPDNILHMIVLMLGSIFVAGFDENFTTTIGKTIYLSRGMSTDLTDPWVYQIVRHEMIHVIDYERFGLWFLISYAALLPCFWTMRSHWEYRGYAGGLIAKNELVEHLDTSIHLPYMLDIFTGPSYFWMEKDVAKVEKKWESIYEQIADGSLSGYYPYSPSYNDSYDGE